MIKRKKISEVLLEKFTGEWGNESLNKNGVKVLRTTNFTNEGRIDYSNIVVREIESNLIEQKKLCFGDVIIEKSGGSPNQPVGRVVFFERKEDDVFLCNNFTSILRAKDEIHPKFLFYSLFYNHLTGKTLKYQNKTTGIINLKLENYLNEEITLPELDHQKRIVEILDKADALRQKRKQALALLDEFLRSTFLEMFGDPFVNLKKWKIENFGQVISILTDYHANGSYEELRKHVKLLNKPDYALMIRTTDLESQNFEEDVKYISKAAYEFLEKSKVYGGEIIFNKIGSAGKVYLMPNLNRPVSLGMNQFMIRLNENMNNIFIYYLLISKYGDAIIQQKVQGAVTKTITKNAIRSLLIPVPPIDLQNQFAKIVEQTEVTRAKMQQSLQEMENQFQALMQRAFKGEL